MPLDPAVRERIESLVESNDVLLFMKGDRSAPQCGFSAKVTQILNTLVPTYQTVNVLADPEIREGIKEFSTWPTIPQLYVKGTFLGGCDIVQELFETGELHKTLGISIENVKAPQVTITDAAAAAFKQAMEQTASDPSVGEPVELRVVVDALFSSNMSLAPRAENDIECQSNGITILFDPLSASRADGLKIDFMQTDQGAGFKVDNPNAPQVSDIDVATLKQWLDNEEPFELVDVRTPEERAQASIAGSELLTEDEARRLQSLPHDTKLVFHCHHGVRSRAAAEQFAAMGYSNVHSVLGGIDAWSQEIDSTVPRY